MIARRAFGLGALALLLGSTIILTGCDDDSFSRYWTYNYRLMVEVETPEGVKKGHSVISVTRAVSGTLLPGPMRGGGQKAKGEAVAVDLPNGETLFVLLSREYDYGWASKVAGYLVKVPEMDNKGDAFDIDRLYEQIRADRTIYPVETLPMMVRFKDITDPLSVEEVDPDDLAASFGEGYALKSLTVQMTDEPVTVGMQKRLDWLGTTIKATNLDGSRNVVTGAALPGLINTGDFSRGVKK